MEGGIWTGSQRALTAGLVATITLVAFEALAVGTVMPLVVRDLGGLELYGWAFSGFFLGNLVGIVAAGSAIDRGGLRTPLVAGLVLFAGGLLLGGLSTSMPMLVLSRVIQGAGAGVVPAVAYVTIRRGYTEEIRPKMFAILSTAWVVPGLVGPVIGGWIGDHVTWRAVFIGLLPLIAVAAVPTVRSLRNVPPREVDPLDDRANQNGGTARLGDGARLIRAVVITAGAGLILAGASSGSPVLGVALAATGVVIGLPALTGLLPRGTLRAAPGVPAAILLRGILTFAFFGADAYIPLALVVVRGLSATEAGLALTAATLSWTAGSWLQAHRQAAWGRRRLIALGFALLIVSIATSAFVLLPSVPVPIVVVTWGLAGFGMGMSYATLALLVLAEADQRELGFATSALQLTDVLGTSLGTGAGGALIAVSVATGNSEATGITLAFALAIAVAIGGLALTPRLTAVGHALQDRGTRRETAAAE